MLDLSPEKILLLGIIALVVLGPNRLPQAARSLGHFVGQMRRMTNSFHSEVRDVLSEPIEAFNSVVGDLNPTRFPTSMRQAGPSTPPPGSSMVGMSQPQPGDELSRASTPMPGPVAALGASMIAPDDPSLN